MTEDRATTGENIRKKLAELTRKFDSDIFGTIDRDLHLSRAEELEQSERTRGKDVMCGGYPYSLRRIQSYSQPLLYTSFWWWWRSAYIFYWTKGKVFYSPTTGRGSRTSKYQKSLN